MNIPGEISPYDSLNLSIDLKGYVTEITGRRFFYDKDGGYLEVEEGETNRYAVAPLAEMMAIRRGHRIEKVTIIYRRMIPMAVYCS